MKRREDALRKRRLCEFAFCCFLVKIWKKTGNLCAINLMVPNSHGYMMILPTKLVFTKFIFNDLL